MGTKATKTELGFASGIEYSMIEAPDPENADATVYSLHAKDHINNQEKTIKTLKTKEGLLRFAEDFLND